MNHLTIFLSSTALAYYDIFRIASVPGEREACIWGLLLLASFGVAAFAIRPFLPRA